MRAVFISGHGGIDKLTWGEVDRPRPGPGEILVRLQAAALNRLDLVVLQGIPGQLLTYPHVMGSDGAGVVEEVGPRVCGAHPGDRVVLNPGISCGGCEFCIAGEHSLCLSFKLLGEQVDGTFAEYVKVPAENAFPMPPGLSFAEAAAFPLVFLTAWRMLFTKTGLRLGEWVLIHGIGGGVASASLQLAVMAGCRVIATSGSDEKLEAAKRLGAKEGINYQKTNVAEAVFKLTEKRGADVVVDCVGAATWRTSILCLARGGRLVTCGATTGPDPAADILRIFWKQLTILGSTMGSRKEFAAMLEPFKGGTLRPVIDRTYPLAEAARALQRLQGQQQFGKIVLMVNA